MSLIMTRILHLFGYVFNCFSSLYMFFFITSLSVFSSDLSMHATPQHPINLPFSGAAFKQTEQNVLERPSFRTVNGMCHGRQQRQLWESCPEYTVISLRTCWFFHTFCFARGLEAPSAPREVDPLSESAGLKFLA